jgi:hypothetical protein
MMAACRKDGVMKTTVAFSVLAAVSFVAIPVSASAECVGYHQSKTVSISAPAPKTAETATAPAATQAADAGTPAKSSAPDNLVADLTSSGSPAEVKAE